MQNPQGHSVGRCSRYHHVTSEQLRYLGENHGAVDWLRPRLWLGQIEGATLTTVRLSIACAFNEFIQNAFATAELLSRRLALALVNQARKLSQSSNLRIIG